MPYGKHWYAGANPTLKNIDSHRQACSGHQQQRTLQIQRYQKKIAIMDNDITKGDYGIAKNIPIETSESEKTAYVN